MSFFRNIIQDSQGAHLLSKGNSSLLDLESENFLDDHMDTEVLKESMSNIEAHQQASIKTENNTSAGLSVINGEPNRPADTMLSEKQPKTIKRSAHNSSKPAQQKSIADKPVNRNIQQKLAPQIQKKPVQAQTAINRQINRAKNQGMANQSSHLNSPVKAGKSASAVSNKTQALSKQQPSKQAKNSIVTHISNNSYARNITQLFKQGVGRSSIGESKKNTTQNLVPKDETTKDASVMAADVVLVNNNKLPPAIEISQNLLQNSNNQRPLISGNREQQKPQVRIGQVNVVVEGAKSVAKANKTEVDMDLSSRLFLRGF